MCILLPLYILISNSLSNTNHLLIDLLVLFHQLLGEHIQRELMLLSEAEGKAAISADLTETELQARLPLQQVIQSCTQHLQLLNHRLAETQSVLGALEHFLSSLHLLNNEVSTADCTSPSTATPDFTSRLVSIREKLQQATEEAVQIDGMLKDAGMSVSLDKKPGSCQDLVAGCATKIKALERKEAQSSKEEEKRERLLKKKRKALQVTLNEVKGSLERQSLKEPTIPALQHRLGRRTMITDGNVETFMSFMVVLAFYSIAEAGSKSKKKKKKKIISKWDVSL